MMQFIAAVAQDRRFLSLSTQDGLPQNSVECFAQDSAGFLWIGTQDGLARFDGYKMLVFRNDPQDEASISDNFITRLFIDNEGDLWVGTRNGVNFFDQSNSRFIKFFPALNKHHQSASGLTQGDNHKVIITIAGRSYIIDKKASWLAKNALENRSDLELEFVRNCQVLLRNEDKTNGLSDSLLWSCSGENCEAIPLQSTWTNLLKSEKRLLQTEKGLWVIANGLYFLSKRTGIIKPVYFDGFESVAYLNSVCALGDELWVSTDKGVFILDQNDPTRLIDHCVSNPDDEFSLNYDFVHGMFADREDRLWIGTANNGLNIYNPRWEQLHYINHVDAESMISNPLVWCSMLSQDSVLWIGTAGGISRLQFNVNSKSNPIKLPIPEKLQHLSSIRDMVEDEHGGIWIASSRSGLFYYNPSLDRLDVFPALAVEMVCLALDEQKGIWAGSYNGLFYASNGKSNFQRMDDMFGFSAYTMNLRSESGFVSVCHSNGFAKVQLGPQLSVIKTSAEIGMPGSLPFSICSDAVSTREQTYVGMYDRGFAILDTSLKLGGIIDESNGLLGHVVESMIEDDNGFVWIATNQGLSRYEPSTKQINRISVETGLRNQEFTLGSGRKGHDGWLFFGSVDGLLFFHPDSLSIAVSNLDARIKLTDLEVNYEHYQSAELAFSHIHSFGQNI